MKRAVILLLAPLCAACSDTDKTTTAGPPVQGSPAALDAENGFRGVQFGSGPEGLRNAAVQWQKGNRATYEQDNRVWAVDSIAPLVYWDFEGGRLTDIRYGYNKQNIQPALASFRARYGPERVSNDTLYWQGQRVRLSAFIEPEVKMLAVRLRALQIATSN